MSKLRTASLIAYGLNAAGFVLFGVLYLTRSEFMPYHSEAVGLAWDGVPARFQVLILGMIHLIGLLDLVVGCAVGAMLWFPWRRGEAWAYWLVPALLFALTGATLRITLEIASKTGAHTPWQMPLGGLALTVAGMMLGAMGRGNRANRPVDLRTR